MNPILATHTATLALLLRTAQSRPGATALLNAGLFPAIRASTLFSTDPDIGLDVEDPSALHVFFGLMLAVLRLVCGVLLARGVGNEQIVREVRGFLDENRQGVVAVFKRNGGIGYSKPRAGTLENEGEEEKGGLEGVLGECVDMYALLISASGWLEVSVPSLSFFPVLVRCLRG